jgi:Fur family ferric uptake transcriptional regulator
MSDPELLLGQARRRGLRITEQRAIILRALCELDGHASVERVHSRVAREHPGVARSTVYRTLEKLRDLRILSQTDLGRGCDEYEVVTHLPHHHLVCQGCGRVADLDHAYFAFVGDAVCRDFGFKVVLDHLAIFGLCRECQESRGRSG